MLLGFNAGFTLTMGDPSPGDGGSYSLGTYRYGRTDPLGKFKIRDMVDAPEWKPSLSPVPIINPLLRKIKTLTNMMIIADPTF
ncbi:hypothetical protein GDO78_017319 [Eleutherodactylus coqui]|uniref:Uncharacterized protein n=1 Tax=Eleutherodactylus coqui TaxID=57060 RepID=A0A8J6BDV3_ELECQ|nr:hypothetical protein GDO78_017319 [Eleutherodactylus coqui]